MNSKAIGGLILAGVLVVGGVFAFASRSTSNDQNNTELAQESAESGAATTQQVNENGSPAFPQLTQGGSYVATITTQDEQSPSNNSEIILVYDGPELWSLSLSSDQGSQETVFAGQFSYIQGPDGSWTRFPVPEGSANDPIDGYVLDDDDYRSIEETSQYLGTEGCSLGTCDVWEARNQQGEFDGKIWVGQDGRLARAQTTDGTAINELRYDYSADTTVVVPTDFNDFALPENGEIDLESLESLLSQ